MLFPVQIYEQKKKIFINFLNPELSDEGLKGPSWTVSSFTDIEQEKSNTGNK